ncbi:MAG: dephospho-CoA kinase [Comamonas sp.]|nr:dephospho-CoA kinase [Comamonas sp.]
MPLRRCVRLGATGGIGSGKSTFSGMLARCGAAVIDADAISRSVTAAGGAAIAPIRTRFGAQFITADGALDRARMRALAFADAGARARLEAIVHPLVVQAVLRASQEAERGGARLIVHDIPLLTESSHWLPRLDAMLVVDCLEETQVRRVVERNQLDAQAVRAIMATQSSRAKRLAAADCIVFNDGIGLDELHTKAHQLAAWFGL